MEDALGSLAAYAPPSIIRACSTGRRSRVDDLCIQIRHSLNWYAFAFYHVISLTHITAPANMQTIRFLPAISDVALWFSLECCDQYVYARSCHVLRQPLAL